MHDYLEQDVRLTPQWADYHEDFEARGCGTGGCGRGGFRVAGGSLLLDDVALEQIDGDATNRTAFRDEVVRTLKELRPGVLRLMSSHAELGSTVDNLLVPPMARAAVGLLDLGDDDGGYSGGDSGVSRIVPRGGGGAVDCCADGDERGRGTEAG